MSGAGLDYNDRVMESTTTSGTGTLTLAGAVAGYQSFSSAFVDKQDVYYAIVDGSNNWEVGVGTFTLSGTTLSRTTVLSSSNSNALVSFTGSGMTVWCDHPAAAIADMAMTAAFSMHMIPQ